MQEKLIFWNVTLGMGNFQIAMLDIQLNLERPGDLQMGYVNQEDNSETDHLKGLDLHLGLKE